MIINAPQRTINNSDDLLLARIDVSFMAYLRLKVNQNSVVHNIEATVLYCINVGYRVQKRLLQTMQFFNRSVSNSSWMKNSWERATTPVRLSFQWEPIRGWLCGHNDRLVSRVVKHLKWRWGSLDMFIIRS